MNKILVEVSVGELFDKISILEIKKEKIKDPEKLNHINEEYNVLLKNAKATICMSEFKEGWCRVLHEAAIHGTPILGSGLGGMKELLEIGGFAASTTEILEEDLKTRTKEDYVSKAIKFSSNLKELSNIRSSLRNQALQSPVFNPINFSNYFDKMLWEFWNKRAKN